MEICVECGNLIEKEELANEPEQPYHEDCYQLAKDSLIG